MKPSKYISQKFYNSRYHIQPKTPGVFYSSIVKACKCKSLGRNYSHAIYWEEKDIYRLNILAASKHLFICSTCTLRFKRTVSSHDAGVSEMEL